MSMCFRHNNVPYPKPPNDFLQFLTEYLLPLFPNDIVRIVLHLSEAHCVDCPQTFCVPAQKYIFFIPSIRKFHNYYLHVNDSRLLLRYARFLISCGDYLMNTQEKRPECTWRDDDCRSDFCWSCLAIMKARECMIHKLVQRMQQVYARLNVFNIQKMCTRCGFLKDRHFHTCRIESLCKINTRMLDACNFYRYSRSSESTK